MLETDIAIVGGGPAGSAAAFRLARLGYRVVQVIAGPPLTERSEVLPSSIERLQRAIPLAPALENHPLASFTRIRWSGFGEEVRPHPGTRLVQRAAFDQSLLDIACAAGVVQIRPARARRPHRTPEGWFVPIETAQGSLCVRARILVDAAGRSGGLGRNSRQLGPPTVALSARWTATSIKVGEIWIEALADGWCWGAGLGGGVMEAATFISMAECAGRGRRELRRRHCELLMQSERFRHALHGATAGSVSICDATPRLEETPARGDVVRIGDAAFAPDPISSQGVQAAMRSGVQAVATIHTILSGGDAHAAIAFYRDAVQAGAMQHRAIAAELYAGHERWRDCQFWCARAEPLGGEPSPWRPTRTISENEYLALSRNVRIAAAPALIGDLIEQVPSVIHSSEGRPITWLNGHLLAPLLHRLPPGGCASSIIADWSTVMPADEAASTLRWLVARGIVEACEATPAVVECSVKTRTTCSRTMPGQGMWSA